VTFGWEKVCVSWTMPAVSTVAMSPSMATPSSGSMSATISQVAAASASTYAAADSLPSFEM
jgi:hypothetical protein